MILCTVGTTMPFDALIREVDRSCGRGAFENEQVVCQIGHSRYIPIHCSHFRFSYEFDKLMDEARLIITHGGTGSVLGCLEKGKAFIAVANRDADGAHQVEFLEKLATIYPMTWTENVSEIERLVKNLKHSGLALKSTTDLAEYIKSSIDGKSHPN